MITLLICFAVIFVLVLAFSSDKKRTIVHKLDPAGREVVEVHETTGATPAQTAARVVIAIPLIVIGILLLLFLALGH